MDCETGSRRMMLCMPTLMHAPAGAVRSAGQRVKGNQDAKHVLSYTMYVFVLQTANRPVPATKKQVSPNLNSRSECISIPVVQ